MLTKQTSQWNQIPDQQRKLTALRIPTSPNVFGVYIPCFWDLKSFLSAFFCSLLCLWNSFTLLNTTVQFSHYCFSITLCDCTTVCLYNINGSLSRSQFGNNSNFATVNTFVHVETHIHTKIHKYIHTYLYFRWSRIPGSWNIHLLTLSRWCQTIFQAIQMIIPSTV